MKTIFFAAIGFLSILAISSPAQAQEKELEMAVEMQGKRIEGLTALADKIKNFGFLNITKNVMKKLEDRERKEDPFGMAMDPEEELPELQIEEVIEEGEIEALPRTSLQEALQKFQPSGFFPSRGEIIVGAQNLGVGDEVVIDYKGVTFNLTIEDVNRTEVVMKDVDTGEVASKILGFDNKLPAGMSRRRPEASVADKSRRQSTIIPFSEGVVKVE
jgi:hypothetical protein